MRSLGEAFAKEWSNDCSASSVADALCLLETAPEEGIIQLENIAEKGSVVAQTVIGKIFMFATHGIEKDRTKALKWLTLAYRQGSVEAGFFLAKMYEFQTDIDQAVGLYKDLAERKFSPAYHSLGCISYDRPNDSQSKMEALHYFNKGMEMGHLHCWSWSLFLTRNQNKSFKTRIIRILSRVKLALLFSYFLFFREYSDRVKR